MIMIRKTLFPVVGAAVLAVAASSAVSAATIKFYDETDPTTTFRGTFVCSLGCEAAWFDSNDPTIATVTSWSSTEGDLIWNTGGAPDSTNFVNDVLGTSYDKDDDRTETARGGLENTSFVSNAEYILFKIGTTPNVGLIKNTGGFGNLFTYTAVSGVGAGLSNTQEFGEYPDPSGGVIPLPAGLPLILSALGLTGLLRLRHRKSA